MLSRRSRITAASSSPPLAAVSQARDGERDLLEPSTLLGLIYFHGTLSHLPAEPQFFRRPEQYMRFRYCSNRLSVIWGKVPAVEARGQKQRITQCSGVVASPAHGGHLEHSVTGRDPCLALMNNAQGPNRVSSGTVRSRVYIHVSRRVHGQSDKHQARESSSLKPSTTIITAT